MNTQPRLLSIGLAITLVCCASGKTIGQTPISPEEIQRLATPYVEAGVVNAMSIGVVQGDQSFTLHYGTLSESSDATPDDATVYEIGSVTKVFTGILLADAVARGRVELDQPIGSIMTDCRKRRRQSSQEASGPIPGM